METNESNKNFSAVNNLMEFAKTDSVTEAMTSQMNKAIEQQRIAGSERPTIVVNNDNLPESSKPSSLPCHHPGHQRIQDSTDISALSHNDTLPPQSQERSLGVNPIKLIMLVAFAALIGYMFFVTALGSCSESGSVGLASALCTLAVLLPTSFKYRGFDYGVEINMNMLSMAFLLVLLIESGVVAWCVCISSEGIVLLYGITTLIYCACAYNVFRAVRDA